LAFGVESVPWNHPDSLVFRVIGEIIGSYQKHSMNFGDSSHSLAENLASTNVGLQYRVIHMPLEDTGLFGVYAESNFEDSDDMSFAVLNEWVRIAKNATDSEVERAKFALKHRFLTSLDSSQSIADALGRQVVHHGRPIPPAELWSRVDAITTKHVRCVASEFLTDVDIAVGAVGPVGPLPDYTTLRGWTYWNRT